MNESNPDFLPAQHVELDLAIRDLLPERLLQITAVGEDAYGVHVFYEVTPPINPAGWEDAIKEDAVEYIWFIFGRDDLGNQYESGGGAYGLAADGQHTEGEHSLVPVPPANASWLEISFYAAVDERPFERPQHILKVNLPLGESPKHLD